jgi:hypothetical protein
VAISAGASLPICDGVDGLRQGRLGGPVGRHGVVNPLRRGVDWQVDVGLSVGATPPAISLAGAVRLSNFRVAPLWQRMTTSVDVRATTGRPRSSQTNPISSTRPNRS